MIEVDALTKRFGRVVAVDGISFSAGAGRGTGFLGPNGAGKTTTLRTIVGLVRPTSGGATVLGKPYRELPDPSRSVGAVLETSSFHPGRSGRNHLRVLARAAELPASRVDEVLRLVELEDAAGRFPGAVVGPADREESTVVVNDGGSDAHGVLGGRVGNGGSSG